MPLDRKVIAASQVCQVLQGRWDTQVWMGRGDRRAVQVNQVLRDRRARGAGRDRWAPAEKLEPQDLEKKEIKDLKVNQDVPVLRVLLDLWGQKVPWESRAPLEVLVFLVQKVSRVKLELQEQKVTVEQQGCQEPKETLEKEDHVDLQVNQDSLELKALLDQRDLKGFQVRQVQWDFLV